MVLVIDETDFLEQGVVQRGAAAHRFTGGSTHDITQAEPLATQVEPKALLGDKGYDADGFINSLEVRAIKAVIAPKSNRKIRRDCDFALYAERNLIERSFNAIKHCRGIATRYEKTARNFLAGMHLVCALACSNDDRP